MNTPGLTSANDVEVGERGEVSGSAIMNVSTSRRMTTRVPHLDRSKTSCFIASTEAMTGSAICVGPHKCKRVVKIFEEKHVRRNKQTNGGADPL